MIGRPSTARLLEVVRQELREAVGPKLGNDPGAAASLHMIDHLLETLAKRAAHEVAWMVEETATLTTFGEEAVAALGEGSRTAAALDALRAAGPGTLHVTDVEARYSLASEVLSCALEEAEPGSPVAMAADASLDARLAREHEILGSFQLVGRG